MSGAEAERAARLRRIRRRVDQALLATGLLSTHLARLIGMSRSGWQNVLNGNRPMTGLVERSIEAHALLAEYAPDAFAALVARRASRPPRKSTP
jgi:hypothetical protein